MLIGARFVQGVGGALTSAVILGMIVTMFPAPAEQAKAIGVFGFVASAGGSIGLLAGGVVTEAISWHWIFFINLPIGAATAYLAVRLVEDRGGIGFREGADMIGALLLTAGLMLGVYTILGIAEHGWISAHTLFLGGVSLALQAAFVLRQARIPNPLMPLRLFRSRNVAGANVIQALLVAGMFGMFFLGALYMQQILGYDPLEVGLAFLPATIVMGAMSLRVSDRLVMRFGPRATLIPGLMLIGVGLLLFARTPVDGSFATDLVPPMVLLGAGAGLGFPSLMNLAMSGATESDSGLASGLVNSSVQVGGAIGLAVLATLAAQRTDNLLAAGERNAVALNSGYHLAYLVGAALVGPPWCSPSSYLEPSPGGRGAGGSRGRAGLLRGALARPASPSGSHLAPRILLARPRPGPPGPRAARCGTARSVRRPRRVGPSKTASTHPGPVDRRARHAPLDRSPSQRVPKEDSLYVP